MNQYIIYVLSQLHGLAGAFLILMFLSCSLFIPTFTIDSADRSKWMVWVTALTLLLGSISMALWCLVPDKETADKIACEISICVDKPTDPKK